MMKRTGFVVLLALLVLCLLPVDGFGQKRKKGAELQSEAEPKTEEKAEVYIQQTYTAPRMFLFGMAQSLADSVTYFTGISAVDNILFDRQTKTAVGVELYTQSLIDYLAQQGKTGYLCSTFMCRSRAEAEKKILKLRSRVQRNPATRLRPIGDFQYRYISTGHIFNNAGQRVSEEEDVAQ